MTPPSQYPSAREESTVIIPDWNIVRQLGFVFTTRADHGSVFIDPGSNELAFRDWNVGYQEISHGLDTWN